MTHIDNEVHLDVLDIEEGATTSPVNLEGLGTSVGGEGTIEGDRFTTPGGVITGVDTITDEEIFDVLKETPAVPTEEDAVVDGDAVDTGLDDISTDKPFNGLDGAGVRGEIAKGSDTGKTFLKEISNRRDLEAITGEADALLSNIGFSTITAEAEAPTLVSSEIALDIADKLLSGTNAFSDLGLQDTQANDPAAIRRFFLSQGQSEEQVKSILSAVDTRLKEQRVSRDATTVIERKQTQLDEKFARDSALIEEQSTKSQNLLQRQRALRGVGLSTATEADIAELQKRGQDLITAAQNKNNIEIALFKAKAEGIEAEKITALQDSFNKATTALNKQILDQADLQSKLIAQGKVESGLAFDNLLETLKVSGQDTEAADKNISELVGFLSDKFGNAILVDGKQVPVGGTTIENAAAIDKWAKDIASGITELSTVPSKLRSQVQARIAAGFTGDGTLTSTQIADAGVLANQIFGNDKKASVNAIKKLMLDGKTNDEIVSTLRDAGFSEAYNGSLRAGFENVLKAMPAAKQGIIKDEFNRRIEDGELDSAYSYMLTLARDSVSTAQNEKIVGTQALVKDIVAIRDGFAELMSDPEAQQLFKTGKITGTIEQVAQALGNTTNPKLATIWAEINQSIINYRQSKSGAAFSEAEAKQYEALFPSGAKSIELNAALIQSIINTAKRATESFYEDTIGAKEYNEIFTDGVLDHIYPGLGLTSIKGDARADSDLDSQIDGLIEAKTFTQDDIGNASDQDLDTILDFNGPDQTGSTKGTQTEEFNNRNVTLNTNVLDSFAQANNEFKNQFGGDIKLGSEITASSRTTEQQQKLFGQGRNETELSQAGFNANDAKRFADPSKNIVTNADGITNKSKHQEGTAIDIRAEDIEKAKPILERFGFKQTIPEGDAGHFELIIT